MNKPINKPEFDRPFTIKPAANGVIIEPIRDANTAYDDTSRMLFVDVHELQLFIADLISGDVTL